MASIRFIVGFSLVLMCFETAQAQDRNLPSESETASDGDLFDDKVFDSIYISDYNFKTGQLENLSCDAISNTQYCSNKCIQPRRIPAMIGDFFAGARYNIGSDQLLDRLMIVANDLDVPLALGSTALPLTVSEPGPIGIFSTSVNSASEIGALLRAGSPFPGATLEGTINQDATLTTLANIAQIQAQLAGTALPYDVILLQDPGAAYATGLATAFLNRTGQSGNVVFNANASGALLQAGADTLIGGEDLDAFYFYDYVIRFNANLNNISGSTGRIKMADGGTVLPQDRIFFRYSYFDNVRGGRSLNRFTPGFERAVLDGLVSFEMRAPFASDGVASSTLDGDVLSTGDRTQFGNLSTIAKVLLLQRETLALSGGIGVVIPTASDTVVNFASGDPLLDISNDSVFLQPFLGCLYRPSPNWFAHGFVQCDMAASGNSVAVNSGSGLANAGTLTERNYLYADFGVGFWAYRNTTANLLTAIIPTVEVHQTNSLNGGDVITSGPIQLVTDSGATSLTSAVVGSTFEFRQGSQLTIGYATPLGGGVDQQYDGALRAMLSCSR